MEDMKMLLFALLLKADSYLTPGYCSRCFTASLHAELSSLMISTSSRPSTKVATVQLLSHSPEQE
jgi:hypothetical protein